ncbi:MAG: hypothetical protein AAF614_32395 [Chloroflexota bacterium]
MAKPEPLYVGTYYRIYNRGNNRENLFLSAKNYRFFLQRYAHFIEPVAKTFAYCLLPNHFHFSIYTRTMEEQHDYYKQHLASPEDQATANWEPLDPTQQFRSFFISYAMAFNRQQERTGSLFQKPFKRKRVDNERYFTHLVAYIHRNPQTHGFAADFREWPWSSYTTMLSDRDTRVQREEVMAWFGGRNAFIDGHLQEEDKIAVDAICLE